MNSSFTQPEILKQLGPLRIARFFQDFTEDLKAAGLVPPDHDSDPGNYFNSVAALFASPALPGRLRSVLLAVELLAAPENSDRLESAVSCYLPNISFPLNAPPLDRALELWFYSPKTLLNLAAAEIPISHAAGVSVPCGADSSHHPVRHSLGGDGSLRATAEAPSEGGLATPKSRV